MSVALRIKEIYKGLKPVQKRIADYFLELPMENLDRSIDEHAGKSDASVASLSRFCKKLGFSSFQRFKMGLTQDLAQAPDMQLAIFRETDDENSSIHKAFREGITHLADTEKTVSCDHIRQTASAMLAAETVYFFGQGGSGGICRLAELFFMQLGLRTKAVTDYYGILVCAGHIREGDCAMGISHSGTTKAVIEALHMAREKGAFVSCITNYAGSPITAEADAAMVTACYEGRVHIAQSNSVIAQLGILQALYIICASKVPRDAVARVNEIEKLIRQNLRIK